jgi:hypothetical protein
MVTERAVTDAQGMMAFMPGDSFSIPGCFISER